MARYLRRTGGLLAALALTGLATAVATAPAQAAGPADAVIRAAHFSPTTPGVDVYLSPFSGGGSRTVWLTKVTYGTVSPYQSLSPGVYTVAMRPAGASPSTRPMLTWTLNARSGGAYTVAGVGAGSAVRGVVIPDDLSAPPAGQGRVRVIQAASRAPVATVSATSGAVIAQQARFATVTSYAALPAGTWDVKAVSRSMPSVVATSPVKVQSGQNTSILLLDAKSSGITLRTLLDSSSSGVMPSSAVPAGAGGTAQHVINSGGGFSRASWLAGAAALLILAAFSLLMSGRRSSPELHGRHAAA